MKSRMSLLALALLVMSAAAFAQEQTSDDNAEDTGSRVFQLVLPSDHLLGDWGACDRNSRNPVSHQDGFSSPTLRETLAAAAIKVRRRPAVPNSVFSSI